MLRPHSFPILITFVIFIFLGIAVIPFIPVQLKPDYTLPFITIRYSWADAQPSAIEQEVTSTLEGVFASMRGAKNVKSESGSGKGQITIDFDKNTDIDLARFDISNIIRRVYPMLPEGFSYPSINTGGQESGDRPVLVYTLLADIPSQQILAVAETQIKGKIAQVKGVGNIEIYGATPDEWLITYFPDKMQAAGISANDISVAVNSIQKQYPIGMGKTMSGSSEKSFVLQNNSNDSFIWENIPISNNNDRTVLLGEIAKVEKRQQPPSSYFRINGQNTIYMAVYAQKNQNQIRLANKIKQKINEITTQPGNAITCLVNSDPTRFIESEIIKNIWRMLATLAILFLFVFIVSRNFRYLWIMGLSLFANVSISFFFYYLLGIELHLFSFAGFTVSLGFLIDNSIVMTDHLRYKSNLKVFTALLASTLTTIAALCIVFFLDERTRLQLSDFSAVVIINLSVSLIIALLFIPALLDILPLAKAGRVEKKIRRKRRVLKITAIYELALRFINRYKKWTFAFAIIGFGLPVFLLPNHLGIESNNHFTNEVELTFWEKTYNKTFGSELYNENIREYANLALGGALRLFMEKNDFSSYFAEPEQTKLMISAQMPEGATLVHLNEVFERIETYLKQFKEIDRFETGIYNSREGEMTVTFKKEYEFSDFPFMLKELITQQAINITDADWQVSGIGDGFNNSLTEQTGSYKITMLGYNYEDLTRHTERLRDKLLVNQRIKEINIMGRDLRTREFEHEYLATASNELLTLTNTNLAGISGFVNQLTVNGDRIGRFYLNGKYNNVVLTSGFSGLYDQWQFNYGIIGNTPRQVKLADVAQVQKQRTANTINKNNQQYQLILEYDYIGTYEMGSYVLDETLKEFAPTLPIGYTANENNRQSLSKHEQYSQLKLILLVIVLIYFICAILFNSLLQPLAVIFTIPISLIGVFLTFYWFNINFGQGGFAAIVLLSGLTVNAAIYIVNERNGIQNKQNALYSFKIYLKAFNTKIIPILLTILSTILGLVPFLAAGQKETFWFSLAMGTSGGLLFSLISIFFYLPLFFIKKL